MSTPGTAVTPSAPAPPAPRSRKALYLVVMVVVVAALLMAFLVLPALTPSSSSGGPAVLTYRGAAPIANGTAGGYAGGGWTLLFAAGIDSATNETLTVNATALGNLTSYCTYTRVASLSSFSLPSFTGNRSAGEAPAWEFGYRNSSDVIAIVSVIDGHGVVFATLSGLSCALYAQVLSAVPGSAIDSSTAARAVEPEAAAFLAAHPNASAEFGLVGGSIPFLGHGLPSEWFIEYSTCAFSTTATGTGDTFNATVNALTGHVLGSNTTTGVVCTGSTTAAVPVASPPAPDLTTDLSGAVARGGASG